jgi:hypothetical protein
METRFRANVVIKKGIKERRMARRFGDEHRVGQVLTIAREDLSVF